MQTKGDILGQEAIRSLRNYLSTKLDGFRQKAWDRCRELGINLSGLTPDYAGAAFLLAHLILHGYGR
jgi:hypothetical protein